MRIIYIVLTLLILGCEPAVYMTNDEIIKETKKCEDAGLRAYAVTTGMDSDKVSVIRCLPK